MITLWSDPHIHTGYGMEARFASHMPSNCTEGTAHRRKNCPACCVLIGRSQSTQKVGVEMDWVDPKINDPRQGDLGIL
ncbi:hypothetical protein TNCV_801591 [Trichonephila clavipes]|nr:hypothetical protein TNCV_801591 [Trichonephila clavipes]